jgi:hypothetical protein
LLLALGPGVARATVVTFDDLGSGPGAIPYGYDHVGLEWTNWYCDTGSFEPAYFGGVESSPNIAFNAYGTAATIMASSSPFYFDGAWFKGTYSDNLMLTVDDYSGSNLVYSKTVDLGSAEATTPMWVSFDWAGVTDLVFSGSGGTAPDAFGPGYPYQFTMDNFTFNQPVPEPISLIFFGTGLVGVCGYVARRRKR